MEPRCHHHERVGQRHRHILAYQRDDGPELRWHRLSLLAPELALKHHDTWPVDGMCLIGHGWVPERLHAAELLVPSGHTDCCPDLHTDDVADQGPDTDAHTGAHAAPHAGTNAYKITHESDFHTYKRSDEHDVAHH